MDGRRAIETEMRRRLWYSLYVLDRLLALQLGRPAAIHEDGYNVELPEVVDDTLLDSSKNGSPVPSIYETSINEYFLSVISFSGIVGQVMRDIYNLFGVNKSIEEMLSHTVRLDHEVTQWKLGLPRKLRFDLGHTFEKSVTFQRQVCHTSP